MYLVIGNPGNFCFRKGYNIMSVGMCVAYFELLV